MAIVDIYDDSISFLDQRWPRIKGNVHRRLMEKLQAGAQLTREELSLVALYVESYVHLVCQHWNTRNRVCNTLLKVERMEEKHG